MKRANLEDGTVIKNKWRSGVVGEIRILGGDHHVKWSDGDGRFEILDSYDIGPIVK